MRRFPIRVLTAALLPFVSMQAVASVLQVRELGGDVKIQRGSTELAAAAGDVLIEGDTLLTGSGARLNLVLGGKDGLEIGGNAILSLHRLPYASFARDGVVALRLRQGYLRVLREATGMLWPMTVSLGPYRARVREGEYFFETPDRPATAVVACSSTGVLLIVDQESRHERLAPSSCHILRGDSPPEAVRFDAADWADARRSYSLTSAPPASFAATKAQGQRRPQFEIVHRAGSRTPFTGDAAAMAPRPPPPIAGSGGWTLILASLDSAAAAEREVARLNRKGYSSQVQPAETAGRTRYRVRLPGYASRTEALQARAAIERELGLSGVWVSPE